MDIIGGLIAFFIGACASSLNGVLSIKLMQTKFYLALILRQLVSFAILFTAFMLRNSVPFSASYLLIGTALGIVLPSLLIAVRFSKQNKAKTQERRKAPKTRIHT
ncbi:MAG: hypothetical protein RSD32_01910 [Oscillospiraceae bacterium]